MLAGVPLRDGAGWLNVLLIVVLGCVPALFGLRGWIVRRLLAALAARPLYAVACQLAFNSGRIVAFVDPLSALALSLLGTLAVVTSARRSSGSTPATLFARFVPPGVVDEVLARTDDDLRLGGVERVAPSCSATCEASQLRRDPAGERVIEVVNFYLNEMTEAILDAGGTLIDYMGDGIMAAFGVPLEQDDHADRALRRRAGDGRVAPPALQPVAADAARMSPSRWASASTAAP